MKSALTSGFCFTTLIFTAALVLRAAGADEVVEVHVDFSRTNGTLRPLHGINRGPLVAGGMIDLTESQRALQIPFTRLHDSHWPNSDVVDIHAVFPDFSRDASNPASYNFARTDEYLAAIRQTGARIVYRLGESIEHDKVKRFVHPPGDFRKWAQICSGIIRHYNEGWANGFRYGIQHWEIWNEPENRPAMWTGSDEQFLRLYATTAREIKTQFPNVKVGGPGFGYTGTAMGEIFRAGGLLTNFLAICRRDSLPLDFLSWHCYTDEPHELVVRARGMRRLLDVNGFTNTESHLNEWNYLPGRDWTPISKSKSTPESRQKVYSEISGAHGAAFVASALIELQDAPVDMCNLFHGEAGPFGLFNVNGVPEKNFYAVRAFGELLKTPLRVEVAHAKSPSVAAGRDVSGNAAAIFVSNNSRSPVLARFYYSNLPWRQRNQISVWLLDATHDFQEMPKGTSSAENQIELTLPDHAVVFISLKPALRKQ